MTKLVEIPAVWVTPTKSTPSQRESARKMIRRMRITRVIAFAVISVVSPMVIGFYMLR